MNHLENYQIATVMTGVAQVKYQQLIAQSLVAHAAVFDALDRYHAAQDEADMALQLMLMCAVEQEAREAMLRHQRFDSEQHHLFVVDTDELAAVEHVSRSAARG